MIATLDLPEHLLAEAMRLTGAESSSQVVILALQELVKKNKAVGLKAYKGKVALDLDMDTLRDRDARLG